MFATSFPVRLLIVYHIRFALSTKKPRCDPSELLAFLGERSILDLDVLAGLCGLVDGVQNTHEHHAVVCGGDALLVAADAIHEVADLTGKQTVKVQRGVAGGTHVYEHTVHVGEQLDLGVNTGTALGAEDLDVAYVVLDVQVEGSLHADGHAVVKTDECGSEILNGVLEIDAQSVPGNSPLLFACGYLRIFDSNLKNFFQNLFNIGTETIRFVVYRI